MQRKTKNITSGGMGEPPANDSGTVFKFDDEAASLAALSSVFRRFLAFQTSLALSSTLESFFFVFWQLRLWHVYACGSENVRPHMQTSHHAGLGGESTSDIELSKWL
jgi:hypothetical protein